MFWIFFTLFEIEALDPPPLIFATQKSQTLRVKNSG